MKSVRLGRTEIIANKNGFGALPIQRLSQEKAVYILRKAYDNGIRFFDTARAYSDSEEKLGEALQNYERSSYILATKTAATNRADFFADLHRSLETLAVEYIDLYQFHNPSFCPKPDDESELYDCMLEAKELGLIRHIGLTNHKIHIAEEAVNSDLYDSIQFPFSYLATKEELDLVSLCQQKDIGFIAMKALSGGLITNAKAAYAFQAQFVHVLPIWGIQRERELDEFISLGKAESEMTDQLKEFILQERTELIGDFCRGCGYCMPCPAGIEINTCARMSLLIRRSPSMKQLSEVVREKMRKIEHCFHCNQCVSKCPYKLDTPKLLERNLADYKNIMLNKSMQEELIKEC